ncbi:MAG: hypothetical protein ACD_39C02058G0001, partial [uncultured bacterium]
MKKITRIPFFSAAMLWLVLSSLIVLSGAPILHAQGFDSARPPDLMKDFEALRQRIRQNPRDIAALNSLGIIY